MNVPLAILWTGLRLVLDVAWGGGVATDINTVNGYKINPEVGPSPRFPPDLYHSTGGILGFWYP